MANGSNKEKCEREIENGLFGNVAWGFGRSDSRDHNDGVSILGLSFNSPCFTAIYEALGMTREKLKAYQTNKRVYIKLGDEIDSLREKLSNVTIISGQVQKSDEEWPYIQGHMQVEIADPELADEIRRKIADHEAKRRNIRKELDEVERYIAEIKDDVERQIFEWLFLDGMTQEELGEVLHYSQGRISQIISERLADG